MILKCAIIDDEPLALDLLESYVEKTPFLVLSGRYGSAVEAMSGLNENPADLLFLDIQMPDLNGIDFSKTVGSGCRIVFTTAFGQYALEGFRVNALDYLLKPVSYQEFMEAADRALKWFSALRHGEASGCHDSIFVKSEYRLVRIYTDDILYIESMKDYVKIVTETLTEPVLSLMSLKSLEDMLPPGEFMRVHRSFIVRKDKIRVVERGRIVFGETYIPVGDIYRQAFQNFIGNE